MLQSPTLDGSGAAQTGSFARILKFDTASASGEAIAQYAYPTDKTGQGQGISSLVALNDSQFLVLDRNNRSVGMGATLASPDKSVHLVDISNADDVSAITLPATGTTLAHGVEPLGKLRSSSTSTRMRWRKSVASRPRCGKGWRSDPKVADGSDLVLSGTDNDYSVTQDLTTNAQLDVYFRFGDADPYASSIQCPPGEATGCTGAASSVPGDGTYKLLPGVLHAYKASAADLAMYTAPVPEPETYALFLAGLGFLGVWSKRRSRK